MMKLLRSTCILACAALSAWEAVPAAGQRDTTRAGATPLPGIVARGDREACPGRDDPRARALWEAMRARYDTGLDSASAWTRMRASSGYVASGSLMRFDTVPSERHDGTTDGWTTGDVIRDGQQRGLSFYGAPRVGPGRRGMAGRQRAALARTIERIGYGALNRGVSADISQVLAVWTYPPLDGELAAHFAGDVFGSRTFFRIDRERGPTTLGFCTAPRFRSQPYLSGSLFLRADSSLERVQWHFHTPDPQEDAGGEVRFELPRAETGRALLPSQGETYRRHVADQFFHRRLVYSPWTVDPAPFLPDSLFLPLSAPLGGMEVRSHAPPSKVKP
ncbi:hypothetical protein SAMN05216486_10854 [bacterium JGI 053]|nr:hypothetical protein SAMN05216486_10854 [bacterium JGI 053]